MTSSFFLLLLSNTQSIHARQPGEKSVMTMNEIRKIAIAQGIQPKRMTKAALVKTIQLNEGNFDCYGTASAGICDQTDCIWNADCLKQSASNAA